MITFAFVISHLVLVVAQVDMSCLVSTINWYHEMENGTEILIKVGHVRQLYIHAALKNSKSFLMVRRQRKLRRFHIWFGNLF
jgi:hypothetical protein